MQHYVSQIRAGLILEIAAGLCGVAGAAQAQQAALREACSADYKTLCSGIQPGGGRVLACLQQNAAKVSSGCQKALAAAGKAPR